MGCLQKTVTDSLIAGGLVYGISAAPPLVVPFSIKATANYLLCLKKGDDFDFSERRESIIEQMKPNISRDVVKRYLIRLGELSISSYDDLTSEILKRSYNQIFEDNMRYSFDAFISRISPWNPITQSDYSNISRYSQRLKEVLGESIVDTITSRTQRVIRQQIHFRYTTSKVIHHNINELAQYKWFTYRTVWKMLRRLGHYVNEETVRLACQELESKGILIINFGRNPHHMWVRK